MKSRKKTVISTMLLSILVILISFFYAHIDKNIYLYDRNADTGTYYGTGVLSQGEEVSQTFVSEADHIDGINIKVSMTGNIENVILHYALVDLNTQEVYEAEIDAKKLENNKFNQLSFKTVENAKGQSYKLVLSEENSDEQNGIGFYAAQGSDGKQQLVINEKVSEGTLVTRIVCHQFDWETLIVFMGVVIFIVAFMKVLYKSFK